MNILEEYVNKNIIEKIKNRYNKKTLFNIMERESNTRDILNYFKELGLDIETIVLNRLDLLLLDYKYLKKNISDYQQDLIIPALIDDISNLDYILDSNG